ncbi:TPA: hypothetical protein ACIZBK_002795 [Legionella pneumophila]
MARPSKITTITNELFSLIENKIEAGQYIFSSHATVRGLQRDITEEEAIDMLRGRKGYSRHWNKRKDTFEPLWYSQESQWRYCIEGSTPDGNELRIIITFDEGLMPIITVIKLDRR